MGQRDDLTAWPQAAPTAEHDDDLAAAADAVDAPDLFLFRRVSPGRFLHLGGKGRGTGWAGLVELSLDEVDCAAEAIATQAPTWVTAAAPTRVFGPYYAITAAFVPISSDVLAVFGWPDGLAVTPRPNEALLRAAAVLAAEAIGHVSPAKRLADELEILHAVQAMLQGTAVTFADAAVHVAATAAAALSCEIGVLQMADGRITVVTRGDVAPPETAAARRVAAALLHDPAHLPLCVQDARQRPLAAPLAPNDGVVAYYAIPIGTPVRGMLLLAHTASGPRGFTNLCKELGLRLATSAGAVLDGALLKDQLQSEIERVSREATMDALTGLGNRRAYDDALARARRSVAAGQAASVVVVDVNALKHANDTRGHEFGDRVLRSVAAAVAGAAGPRDTAARIGGDELAVVCDGDAAACVALVARLRTALDRIGEIDGFRVGAAIGYATCPGHGDLERALVQADALMYERKPGVRAQRAAGAY